MYPGPRHQKKLAQKHRLTTVLRNVHFFRDKFTSSRLSARSKNVPVPRVLWNLKLFVHWKKWKRQSCDVDKCGGLIGQSRMIGERGWTMNAARDNRTSHFSSRVLSTSYANSKHAHSGTYQSQTPELQMRIWKIWARIFRQYWRFRVFFSSAKSFGNWIFLLRDVIF